MKINYNQNSDTDRQIMIFEGEKKNSERKWLESNTLRLINKNIDEKRKPIEKHGPFLQVKSTSKRNMLLDINPIYFVMT